MRCSMVMRFKSNRREECVQMPAKMAHIGPLGRRVAAIRYAHKLAGQPVPTDDERV
jgi:hypothetical protein